MSLLESFDGGQGYLKAGFLGFAKSGKSLTAAILACEVIKQFKSKKPVAIFDTEGGGVYISKFIKSKAGKVPIGRRARSLSDLLKVAKECEAGASDVLIVDSVTHIWREVCDSYLNQINQIREAQGRGKRMRLEFQDWSAIKKVWNTWTDFYLNSKLHIIVCGRAGYEWDFEEKEDSSGNTRKELVKTGIKMKVEGEFGFEPSLLMEMERIQVKDDNGTFSLTHNLRVLGDRFQILDGKTCNNPTGEFFIPHLDLLKPGAENTVDTKSTTDMGVDEDGDSQYRRDKKAREIVLEEIQGEIVMHYPGQTSVEKKAKLDLLQKYFKTRSWAAVEIMKLEELRKQLKKIKEMDKPKEKGATS